MKTLLTCLFTLALVSSVRAADLKIATIDMKRAFNEYAQGKEDASKVKANAEKFVEERKERYESYKTLGTEVSKLQKKAQDPILSQAERAKAGAQFESKLKGLRELEGEIKEFEQKRTEQLRTEESQVRTQILEVMTAVVQKLGKDGGYNLVLDRAGSGLGGIPTALFVDGLPDLTDDLIKALNKDAPAPKAEETKKADTKK